MVHWLHRISGDQMKLGIASWGLWPLHMPGLNLN